MRMRSIGLLTALVLCITSCAAPAQGPPSELAFGMFAKTYCMKGMNERGVDTTIVRTSLDATLLQNEGLLDEVTAHEAIHREWYEHNLNQCGHLTPRLALSLEVDAYCRTADIPVHYGGDSSLVYFRDATILVSRFKDTLPYKDIVAAWYLRCGDLLPLPRKGPPVTRDTTRHG